MDGGGWCVHPCVCILVGLVCDCVLGFTVLTLACWICVSV